jgi:glucosyl-3-phosphoglycerate synthase
VGPLLTRPEVDFVKGYYDRPVDGQPHGGGRVTELMARPAIAALFPHLASVVQPLAGEYAGRRSLLERLPFVQGYGVDLGLLIDIADLVGTEAIAQVDLGLRRHRNRPLEELGPQALAVLQTALRRAGHTAREAATLVRPDLEPVEVAIGERAPLVDVSGYRRRSA